MDFKSHPPHKGIYVFKECVFKTNEQANPETGEMEPNTVPFYPTHFRSDKNGYLCEIEDPRVWIEKKEVNAEEDLNEDENVLCNESSHQDEMSTKVK